MFDPNDEAKEQLVNFLKKLGIKSAGHASLGFTISALTRALQFGMGTPDKLYMDPHSYAALSKFLKPDPKLTEEDDKS